MLPEPMHVDWELVYTDGVNAACPGYLKSVCGAPLVFEGSTTYRQYARAGVLSLL